MTEDFVANEASNAFGIVRGERTLDWVDEEHELGAGSQIDVCLFVYVTL